MRIIVPCLLSFKDELRSGLSRGDRLVKQLLRILTVGVLSIPAFSCGGTGEETAGPVTVGLTATQDEVAVGESVELAWMVTGAQSCEASDGWNGGRPTTDGSEKRWIYEDTSFVLTCDGPGGSASGEVEVSAVGSPLQVSVDMDDYLVQEGDTFTVNVTVSNPGSGTVEDVVVSVTIPEFVRIDPDMLPPAATCSAGTCKADETIDWNLYDLTAGRVMALSVEPEVESGAPSGRQLAFAVTASTEDTPDATLSEFAEEGESDVELTLVQTPAQPKAGDEVEYAVIYEYSGPPPASPVELTLVLPNPVELQNATDGQTADADGVVTWSLAEPGTFEATVAVNPDLPSGAQLRTLATGVAEGEATRVRATAIAAVTDPSPECMIDDDCGVGEMCDAGGCVPEVLPPECMIDENCSPGERCDAGSCVPDVSTKLAVTSATASSEWSASFTAQHSVDGSTGSYWSTVGNAVDDVFVDYYFGAPSRISRLRIFSPIRSSAYAVPQTATLTFFAPDDQQLTQQPVTFDGPYDEWQEVALSTSVSGVSRIELRPTALTRENPTYVTIHEIEFFGVAGTE